MSILSRKAELEIIKNFVDRTYNSYGNLLIVNTEKPYDPGHTELGYCFKHRDEKTGNVIYKIECATTGVQDADFRILMHEYGHIYLGHLDGISEELDTQICNVFRDYRPQIIEHINKTCGIDFADKLIERVIDDPSMNHAIHNIAMDFSVNSVVLNANDIELMEKGVDSVLPHTDQEVMEYLSKNVTDKEEQDRFKDALDKMKKETLIKFMLPSRYYLDSGDEAAGIPPTPFPSGLSYPEYLMLIIEHLDQFVKMLVSIQMGGNGDTSQVTQQMIQNALQNANNNWQKKSDEYKQGYNDALNDYKKGQVGQRPNDPNKGQNGQQGQQDQSGNQGGNQNQSGQGQSGQQNGQQGQSSQSGQSGQQGQSGTGGNGSQPGQSQGGNAQGGQSGQNSGAGQGQGQGEGTYDDGYNDALRDIAKSQGQGQSGSGSGMQSLSDMMNSSGMSDGQSGQGQGQSGQGQGQNGQGQDGNSNQGSGGSGQRYQGQRPPLPDADTGKDHRTDSRDEADQKRKVGQIRSGGGFGCGDSGGPDSLRDVSKNLDEVDMALREVLNNVKSRVIKTAAKKDQMKLFNRGVNRSTVVPSRSTKVTVCNDPTIVFLIDISGSMDTALIDRILLTINNNLRKISRGLKYNIITWSTRLGEHIRDIDPKKGVPTISCGGGTRLADGIRYFKNNYDDNAILVVISDFEDYLEEWHEVEKSMPKYSMYGFNYGDCSWKDSDSIDWTYMKVRKFKGSR